VTRDDTWAEPERPHRRGYIAGMLCHAVWTVRLLGVAATTQVNSEERPPSSQTIADAGKG
jgi:hypothetical protein